MYQSSTKKGCEEQNFPLSSLLTSCCNSVYEGCESKLTKCPPEKSSDCRSAGKVLRAAIPFRSSFFRSFLPSKFSAERHLQVAKCFCPLSSFHYDGADGGMAGSDGDGAEEGTATCKPICPPVSKGKEATGSEAGYHAFTCCFMLLCILHT